MKKLFILISLLAQALFCSQIYASALYCGQLHGSAGQNALANPIGTISSAGSRQNLKATFETGKFAKTAATVSQNAIQKKEIDKKFKASCNPALTNKIGKEATRLKTVARQKSFTQMPTINENETLANEQIKKEIASLKPLIVQDSAEKYVAPTIMVEQAEHNKVNDELSQLMAGIVANHVRSAKKISNEIDAIIARIDNRAAKAPNVQEKNKILARYYVSCILLIEKLDFIEKNGLVKFTEPKKKLEVLKIRLFIQIEELSKVIEAHNRFDATLKQAEEYLQQAKAKVYDQSLLSKAIKEYLACQKIIEDMKSNENADSIQRKKDLNILHDQISVYIIEFLNTFFYHTTSAISQISFNTSSDFLHNSNQKKAAWPHVKNNIKIVTFFVGKNEFFVQNALMAPHCVHALAALKLKMEAFLDAVKQLFINLEKKIQEIDSPEQQPLEQWTQITHRIFAQLQMLDSFTIWPSDFAPKAQEKVKDIKQIKDRVIALIDKQFALCKIINGQVLDAMTPYDERLALHQKLHQVLMLSDAPKIKLTQEQTERSATVLNNNAVSLVTKYLEMLQSSLMERNTPQWRFPESIEKLLWHLLEHFCKYKLNISEIDEFDQIDRYYPEIKVKLMNVILDIQNEIRKQIKEAQLTNQSHNDLIAQMRYIYLFLEKLNKYLVQLGLDQNLINIEPCLAALNKRPANLLEQTKKEKDVAEKLMFDSLKMIDEDLSEKNYVELLKNVVSLLAKDNLIGRLGFAPPQESIIAARNALGKNFHLVLQKNLIEIHGEVSQAIIHANLAHNHPDKQIWQTTSNLLNKLLEFVRKIHKSDITHYFAAEKYSQERDRTVELFTQLKNMLFIFIVSYEQEIKKNINNLAIEASIIENQIVQFDWATAQYEKMHKVLFHLGKADKEIDLIHRIVALKRALAKTLPDNQNAQKEAAQE